MGILGQGRKWEERAAWVACLHVAAILPTVATHTSPSASEVNSLNRSLVLWASMDCENLNREQSERQRPGGLYVPVIGCRPNAA